MDKGDALRILEKIVEGTENDPQLGLAEYKSIKKIPSLKKITVVPIDVLVAVLNYISELERERKTKEV